MRRFFNPDALHDYFFEYSYQRKNKTKLNWFEALDTGDPIADQGGLPKAGGRREESQFSVQALVQSLDQGERRTILSRGGGI